MKFTLSWLKEFLDSTATIEEIAVRLTELGLEVEGITNRTDLAPFRIAEILAAGPHPDASKLQICRVNTGSGELQIVCGAPNARAGLKVVLAPIGSVIPAHGLVIKESKIRGVDSQGMLCSARELMVGEDESGIIELPKEAVVGDAYATFAGYDDPVIEIAITPNRGDCLGVYGIARDLAASGLGTLKTPSIEAIKGTISSPITVSNNTSYCTAFIGRYIKGVTNKPSPEWLQNRLRAIGTKPISALVDITNYITFTYGRPLHVYDAAMLSGTITVREAKEGEAFEALGGKHYTLSEGMGVIADDKQVLALGGIIGGNSSGCSLSSTTLFLEAALFDSISIAETGRHLQIDTDARYRFERGVDPAFVKEGAELATKMILELCGGEVSDLIISGTTQASFAAYSLKDTMALVGSFGGVKLEESTIIKILSDLGFTISGDHITTPSWRHDIDCAASLVEEVLRIHGYDKIVPLPLPAPARSFTAALSPQQKRAATTRRLLVSRGLSEAVTWSFMEQEKAVAFGGGSVALRLQNPISVELSTMRPSLLPNLLDSASRNSARGFHDIALFEIGPEFHGIAPEQQRVMITGVRAGKNAPKSIYNDSRDVDCFDAKADCLAVLAECGIPVDRVTVTTNAPNWYHPGRSGVIALGGKNILATFGELHPTISKSFDVKHTVVGFEINLGALPLSKSKQGRKSAPLFSDYQAVVRDFAFIAPGDLPVESLLRSIRGADKLLITDVALFDVYSGKGVEEGKKSVAISVTIQSKEKTLTEEELDEVSKRIIAEAQKNTGVNLRG